MEVMGQHVAKPLKSLQNLLPPIIITLKFGVHLLVKKYCPRNPRVLCCYSVTFLFKNIPTTC